MTTTTTPATTTTTAGTGDGLGPVAEPLDAQAAQILQEVAELPVTAPASLEEALATARAAFPGLVEQFRGTSVSPLPTVVGDELVAGDPPIRVRTYRPADLPPDGMTEDAAGGPVPADVLLYVHGGGWVVGAPDDLDYEMSVFAHRLGMRVVSVDYRLAPEHPYPAAFEDCMTVARHLHADPTVGRVAVAGDSAGGNLAAAIAIACRDEQIPLAAQLLIYPALDPTQQSASQEAFGVGYGLTKADMALYWSVYLPQQPAWSTPTAAPATETDLRGLAPAVVVTAGYDPLCDEGDTYARRLAEAGVRTAHLQNPTLPHAFLIMTGRVQAARSAVERALDAFANHLAT